jgi:hypothetical protein
VEKWLYARFHGYNKKKDASSRNMFGNLLNASVQNASFGTQVQMIVDSLQRGE